MAKTSSYLPIANEKVPLSKADQKEEPSAPDGYSVSRICSVSRARFGRDVLGFIIASLIMFYTVYRLGDGISAYQPIEGRINSLTQDKLSVNPLFKSTTQTVLYDNPDAEFDESKDRALVTYVYSESPSTRKNALFFINHGLHAYADFIIILNGPTDLGSDIPRAPNIKVLVGISMKCDEDEVKRKVMQPMLLTTDRAGLSILLKVTGKCFATSEDALTAEEYAAQTILDAGYNITVMMPSLPPSLSSIHGCTQAEATGNNMNSDIYIHPYETIFEKTNRETTSRQLELLTEWHDVARYSSWDSCWLKRIRNKA
ncbi:hypothetical protein TWF694_001377 [Orbilia ellipsospora]|uniref:Uncharacterized protein n=1 Tax=Orbilia ellipsospora TaxID=2528407 RepID=A0AAV9XSW8_9PEZI